MLNITFERLENYEGYMPIIGISNPLSKNAKKNGYLSPFRFAMFQISGTYTGEWDLGSSVDPISFKNIVKYRSHEEAIKILTIEMVKCINNYLTNNYGFTGQYIAYTVDGKIHNTRYNENKNLVYTTTEELPEVLHQYIEDCYQSIADFYSIEVA